MKFIQLSLPVILCTLFGFGSMQYVSIASAASEPPVIPGIEQLVRLDRLAEFHTSTFVGSVSSYDRTGGNDDGFGGKYSFVRKEGDALVLADLKGPAVGIVQLFQDEAPMGPAVDLYAAQQEKAQTQLGTLALPEGKNNLLFKITGKHEKSSGLGLDLVNIICERID
jgi:hypothetical protein